MHSLSLISVFSLFIIKILLQQLYMKEVRIKNMEQITLSFHIRQFPNIPDTDINVVVLSGTIFRNILQIVVQKLPGGVTVDKIAIITAAGTILSFQEAQQDVVNIIAQYSKNYMLTERSLVNGPNLAQVEPLMPSLPNEIIAQMFNLNELMVIEDQTTTKMGQKQSAPMDFFAAEKEKASFEEVKMKSEEETIEKPPALDLGLKGRIASLEKTELPMDEIASDRSTISPSAAGASSMTPNRPTPSIPAPAAPSRGAPPSPPGGVHPQFSKPQTSTPPPMAAPAPAQEPAPTNKIPLDSASMESNQPIPPPSREMEQKSRRREAKPSPAPKMEVRAKDKAPKEEKKEKAKSSLFRAPAKKMAQPMGMRRSIDDIDTRKMDIKEDRDEAKEETDKELLEMEEADEDLLRSPEELEGSTASLDEKLAIPIIAGEGGGLIPVKTPAPEELSFEKNIAVEYFDKMNPEKYYPLIVNIADIEQATIAPEENIITGERKIQKKEKHEFKLKTSIVVVRPVFPGCEVTPFELQTDFKNPEDELKFYVTPIVKDAVEGRIDFLNEGNVVHSYETPAKCDDPRFAKTIATYGTLASILPKILLIFNIDLGSSITLDQLLPFLGTIAGGINLLNFIAIFGIILFLVIGYIIHRRRQPKSTRTNFSLTDVRMKKLAF